MKVTTISPMMRMRMMHFEERRKVEKPGCCEEPSMLFMFTVRAAIAALSGRLVAVACAALRHSHQLH